MVDIKWDPPLAKLNDGMLKILHKDLQERIAEVQKYIYAQEASYNMTPPSSGYSGFTNITAYDPIYFPPVRIYANNTGIRRGDFVWADLAEIAPEEEQ